MQNGHYMLGLAVIGGPVFIRVPQADADGVSSSATAASSIIWKTLFPTIPLGRTTPRKRPNTFLWSGATLSVRSLVAARVRMVAGMA